jgi:hypothetical protein
MKVTKKSSRPRRRWIRGLITLIVLGLAVHLILPEVAVLKHSLRVLRSMIWWGVGLAVAAQLGSYLGSGLMMKAIAATARSRLSIFRGTAIVAASSSIGLVAGGIANGVSTYQWLHESGVGGDGALLAGFPAWSKTACCCLSPFSGSSTC